MAEGAPDDRLLEALGLARRAGRLVVGARAVREAAEKGELRLTVVAADAGGNALDRLGAIRERSPVVRAVDRRSLGRALGRAAVVAAGVTDAGLAGKIRRLAASAEGADRRTPRRGAPYDAEDRDAPGGEAEKNPIHAS